MSHISNRPIRSYYFKFYESYFESTNQKLLFRHLWVIFWIEHSRINA